MRLTADEFVDRFYNLRGCRFLRLSAVTPQESRMRASRNGIRNPLKGSGLVKHAVVSGAINWRYSNAVNNQRQREGRPRDENGNILRFRSQPRTWGVRLTRQDGTLTPFVSYGDHVYLEVKVQREHAVEYRIGNRVIPTEVVTPWLYDRQSRRQEVQNEIILRDYRLDHIERVITQGDVFEIEKET